MKLLFDARWIRPAAPDGITRYSRELIVELSKLKGVDMTILVHNHKQAVGLPLQKTLIWNRPTSPRELLTSLRLRKHRFDVVYSPHFVFGGLGKNFPLVLTVMDMIPYHRSSKGSSILWRVFFANKLFLRLLLTQANAVATISKTTQDEVSLLTNKPIVEIPCAPAAFLTKVRTKPENRLLYIGRYELYKNVGTIVRGMEGLMGYSLVLAGGIDEDQKTTLEQLASPDVKIEFLGKVSDSEYANQLGRAFAAVTASIDEGFGLQVVEAMKAGVPVVCSAIDIFREVGGKAALYFDAQDPRVFAAQIKKLEDTKVRSYVVSEGQKQAVKYSWKRSASKLAEFLDVLQSKNKGLE